MKKKQKALTVFLVVALLLLSACGLRDLLDPLGIKDNDIFDPLSMNTIREPETVDFGVSRLLYEELTETQKQAYRRIYNTVSSHPAKILIPALSEEELSEVFLALKFDNPHILCLQNTYTYYTASSKFYILPEYNDTAENCEKMTACLLGAAKEICADIPADADAYETELYIHDRLIDSVSYDTGKHSDTAYGALVNHKAACGGYALACKLLFDMADIQSVAVSGKAASADGKSVPHMWLAANINKNWYFVDPAWDDPITNTKDTLRHTYFNVTEEKFALTHSDYTLPAAVSCGASDEDYYLKSGLLLKEDTWEKLLENRFSVVSALPVHFEFRCESPELFATVTERLFDGGELNAFVRTLTGKFGDINVSHSLDEDRDVLHFYIRSNTEE